MILGVQMSWCGVAEAGNGQLSVNAIRCSVCGVIGKQNQILSITSKRKTVYYGLKLSDEVSAADSTMSVATMDNHISSSGATSMSIPNPSKESKRKQQYVPLYDILKLSSHYEIRIFLPYPDPEVLLFLL
jgi:hypothetical protein